MAVSSPAEPAPNKPLLRGVLHQAAFTVSLVTSSADANYVGLTATLSVTNVDRTDHNVCISNVEDQFHYLPGGATALIARPFTTISARMGAQRISISQIP